MSTTLPRHCSAMHSAKPPTHTPLPESGGICDGGRSMLRTRSRFHINNTSFGIKAHGDPVIIWRFWAGMVSRSGGHGPEYVNYQSVAKLMRISYIAGIML